MVLIQQWFWWVNCQWIYHIGKIFPEVHVGVFKGRALGAKHILSFSETPIFAKSFDGFFFFHWFQIWPISRTKNSWPFLGILPLRFYMSILLPILQGRKCPTSETQLIYTLRSASKAAGWKEETLKFSSSGVGLPSSTLAPHNCSGVFRSHPSNDSYGV